MLSPEVIRDRLAKVSDSIRQAEQASGREENCVKLLAVSKYTTPEAVRAAADAGQRDFAENYLQAGREKIEAVGLDHLRWHMIGRVQSNKAREASDVFDLIHGIDSLRAARAISNRNRALTDERGENEAAEVSEILVQIRLGADRERAGVDPEQAPDFLGELAALPGIRVCGVMGIAPVGEPARPHFSRLRDVAETLRSAAAANAPLGEISAGMTSDFEDAIAEGSTIVRIGSAIFGRENE